MSCASRRAFTFIECIVSVAIVGLLLAMLFPALHGAEEQERQKLCALQIRQLGQAMASFEAKKQRYPGYLNVLKKTDNVTIWTAPGTNTKQGASWIVMLLPFMQRDQQYSLLRSQEKTVQPSGGRASKARDGLVSVKEFLCPSYRPRHEDATYLSYVANGGCRDVQTATIHVPRDWADNGVFFDRYSDDPASGAAPGLNVVSVSSANVKDGTGNTLMLTENVDAGQYDDYTEELLAFTWEPSNRPDMSTSPPHVAPTHEWQRINQDIGGRNAKMKGIDYKPPAGGINTPTTLADYARPSSNHQGGVNVVFCDVHTSFLSQDIDYYVYGLLMSANGNRVRKPGATDLLPNWDQPIEEDWIKK